MLTKIRNMKNMKNIVDFDLFESQEPGSGSAGAEVAPAVFGNISFSISGVKDEAVELISILLAQSLINSDQQEASRIIQRIKDDPGSAASYIETRIQGMISNIPGIDPSFADQLISQKSNLSKVMVRAIPNIVGIYVKQMGSTPLDPSKFVKPDLTRSSFFSKLGSYLGLENQ
jgi:hypothetical protein